MDSSINTYKTIKQLSVGEYKDKGSKFLAFAHSVESEDQVKEIIKIYKKEYFDARHHCYAYVLGKDASISKASDDGEPAHSAGSPILGQIKSFDLTNILVVVVRYFGGTKLGVSGLINAYKTATREALISSEIIVVDISISYRLTFSYDMTSYVEKVLNDTQSTVLDRMYNDKCIFLIEVKVAYHSQFQELLTSYEATDIVVELMNSLS